MCITSVPNNRKPFASLSFPPSFPPLIPSLSPSCSLASYIILASGSLIWPKRNKQRVFLKFDVCSLKKKKYCSHPPQPARLPHHLPVRSPLPTVLQQPISTVWRGRGKARSARHGTGAAARCSPATCARADFPPAANPRRLASRAGWPVLLSRWVKCIILSSFGPVPLFSYLILCFRADFFILFFLNRGCLFSQQTPSGLGWLWGRRWPVHMLPDRLSHNLKKKKKKAAFSCSKTFF